MADKFTKIVAPEWMLDLFRSIDEMDTAEDSGFRVLADDVTLQFGSKSMRGIADVKKFFAEVDAPFITQHFVDVVYRHGTAYVMQGSASLRKNGEPPRKSVQAVPLFVLLWLNGEGEVTRYVVDFPPDAARAAGF